MKKLVYTVLGLLCMAGLICAGVCFAMFVMAVRYSKWGRVVVYGFGGLFALELSALCLTRLVRARKQKQPSSDA